MPQNLRVWLISLVAAAPALPAAPSDWPEAWRDNPGWTLEAEGGNRLLVRNAEPAGHLVANNWIGDQILELTFKQSAGGRARLFLQGRYPLELKGGESAGWRTLKVRFRAPRFDEASNKTAPAFLIDARVGEEVLAYHQRFETFDPAAESQWEDAGGATSLLVDAGAFALSRFDNFRADFEHLAIAAESGGPTNEVDLVDYVIRGRETFNSLGCAECHAVKPNDPAIKTGPNLFGLFTLEPREREVTTTDGSLRFTVTANRDYLMRSVRESSRERAVAESGPTAGEPYLPIMPPYSPEVLSDQDVQAISSYLATLNQGSDQGPVVQLVAETGLANSDPMADRFQLLVGARPRLQRGPMNGVSARSIHVGQPHGLHYTFDPRILGVAKVWQGGFLDMSGEWKGRGGQGLRMGYNSREIDLGAPAMLLAPLHADGEPVDFSFKEARFDDEVARRAAVDSEIDHLTMLAAEDANFLGYAMDPRDPQAVPTFRYRVGPNVLSAITRIAADGAVSIEIAGDLTAAQAYRVNTTVLTDPTVTAGELVDGVWTLPAGAAGGGRLTARIGVAADPWRPDPTDFGYEQQPLVVEPSAPELPAGYAGETWLAPRDNYGRPQLFEPLGMAVASDGAVLVAARTGHIWRLADGQWHLFAEGLFDALGLVIEREDGLEVVVGQKAELTRLRDTDGDGVAEVYETLCDDWSYHGNYHSYLHGPIRMADGNYLVTFNLAHSNGTDLHKGEGTVMGATGGFTGWALRVSPDGEMTPWADGMRSPAGLGIDPLGRAWYVDNQGDFVATSKIHHLNRGAFYGHPAGLIDRPGMTPASPQIKYDAVKRSRARAVVLIPQSRLANSLGHPVWDQTGGAFGPFGGQMLIGDQTQSVLLRVTEDQVGPHAQGAAMIFGTGFASGIMRPVFLADGSLLLGQTGRGWQAYGGRVASLQRIWWDGETAPAGIRAMRAIPGGFAVELSSPLAPDLTAPQLAQLLSISSWTYRDAPDYGSAELDERVEAFSRLEIANDRRSFRVRLARTAQPNVHPDQTARVYHLHLDGEILWGDARPRAPGREAFYTLYAFPPMPAVAHPDTNGEGWRDLLNPDLSNADYPAGIWWTEGGELTASEDQMLWTRKSYADFDLDLEFRTAGGTNSGVLFHVSDPSAWVQNSIEIQIADDHSEPWLSAEGSWQAGAIFGRLPAATQAVKVPGEWNRLTLEVRGKEVRVILNGEPVVDADLTLWTSATVNPSGVEIPPWLSKPLAELPTTGRIGFQGKHAGAPVWFRNIRVREIE